MMSYLSSMLPLAAGPAPTLLTVLGATRALPRAC